MTRAQLQERIDQLRSGKDIKVSALKPQIETILNQEELAFDGLTHDFVKNQILSDLITYEGVINE